MSLKITLIGAGSVVFAKNLIGDILQFPELSSAHICLMDIDPARLKVAGVMARKIIAKLGVTATVSETTDQRAAVTGANYVICTIQVGGFKPGTVIDFEIPKKFGLQQTIADTLGVGGVFRALRTIPVMVEIARNIADFGARNCLFLNYTNPMAMNCWAVDRAVGIPHVGLCHSVQGTSAQLAGFARLPMEDVTYLVAGINHMAFFLKFEYRGQDAYPLLFKALQDPSRKSELVRFEMMRRLGYFVTESSEHQAEYVPFFIHHGQEMIDRFQIPIDEYIRRCESVIATWERSERELLGEDGDIVVGPRSHEYGSFIIHSHVTNQPRVVYGNVPNRGYITNLPEGCCVELPCLADANGIQPTRIGALPPQLAAICQTNINVQSLTVEAALTGNRDAIYHAVMLDPHAAATLTLDNMWAMCDELIAAHQKVGLLGEFKPVLPGTGRPAAGIADRVLARLNAIGVLDRTMDLEMEVENPSAAPFAAEFALQSTGTPLQESPVLSIKVAPGETVKLPVSVTFKEDPGEKENILLVTSAVGVLAVGASLKRRPRLDVSSGAAPVALTLAGFPAVEGSLSCSSKGVQLRMRVNDSKVLAEHPATPWEDSCIELFFAPMRGNQVKQFFLLPSPGKDSPVLMSSNREPLHVCEASQEITPIDYSLEVLLPWSELGLEPGDFLFDCYVNLMALGDAHSGGKTRLNGSSQSHRTSDHFSWVRAGDTAAGGA